MSIAWNWPTGRSSNAVDTERTIACWLLAATIFAGFAVPGLSEFLAPCTSGSLLLLIIMSLIPMGRMEGEEVFSFDAKVWQIVLWQLLVCRRSSCLPPIWRALTARLPLLMVTTASAGSLFASPTFAELLQVNKQKALQCMVLVNIPHASVLFHFLHSRSACKC